MKSQRSEGHVAADAATLFAYLDEHAQLSSHMSRPSWRLGGGQMAIETDAAGSKAVGSRIRLGGRVFGIALEVRTQVTERDVPVRKAWATVDEPRLLVVGSYRMGFEVQPEASGCLLRVFIEYEAPRGSVGRLFAMLLGDTYARWCTRQMVVDAQAHFHSARAALHALPS